MTQRKYVLTKIGPGDYMLPSNDAKTVWRIAKYEDGPSHGVEAMGRDREFWGLWKWENEMLPGRAVDTRSWDRWHMVAQSFDTRQEAIDEGMRSVPQEPISQ